MKSEAPQENIEHFDWLNMDVVYEMTFQFDSCQT